VALHRELARKAKSATGARTYSDNISGLASIFGIFLVRQYALAIPDEILDAPDGTRQSLG